jgi:hypothetical protein
MSAREQITYKRSDMPDFTPKNPADEVRQNPNATLTFDKDVCPCATCGHSTWKECMDNRIGNQALGEPLLKPDTRDAASNCRCCNFPRADGVCKH